MTPSEELHKGLAERGIEYGTLVPSGSLAWEYGSKHFCAVEIFGKLYLETSQGPLTPAQAIAATVGSDEPPYNELIEALRRDWDIDVSWDGLRKFWNIALTDEGVKKRDVATVGAGTCKNVGDSSDFMCSECGVRVYIATNDTYTAVLADCETVLKRFNFCPNCGRRIEVGN